MPDNLCEQCTAACCRYVALPIETPTTQADFEDVRWYLIHDNISVFVEDDEWFISFASSCRHVQPDGRCGIYETRPIICRKYSTDNCDYHSGDYGWEHHFSAPEHLEAYLVANPPQPDDSTPRKNGRANLRVKRRQPKPVPTAQDKYGIELPPPPWDTTDHAERRPLPVAAG